MVEQGIDRPTQEAATKGESAQAFNPNGNIIGRFQLADKLPGRQIKGINPAIAEIAHQKMVAEFAKACRNQGHPPGRVQFLP
ncbi:hypothetical protein LZ558_15645 [Methylobacter sp. YRD-M1]|nr:hypothetical protein [Methylobacter sp. YRD-M1]WAK01251.1 hypothetical protein LZ558_15645 [Methylobacter sp. YRD-M1]